jgi:hypothetical protein
MKSFSSKEFFWYWSAWSTKGLKRNRNYGVSLSTAGSETVVGGAVTAVVTLGFGVEETASTALIGTYSSVIHCDGFATCTIFFV